VNNTVPQALMKLGYTPELPTSEIVSHIDQKGDRGKAQPHFKGGALAGFSIARWRTRRGRRSISWTGFLASETMLIASSRRPVPFGARFRNDHQTCPKSRSDIRRDIMNAYTRLRVARSVRAESAVAIYRQVEAIPLGAASPLARRGREKKKEDHRAEGPAALGAGL